MLVLKTNDLKGGVTYQLVVFGRPSHRHFDGFQVWIVVRICGCCCGCGREDEREDECVRDRESKRR